MHLISANLCIFVYIICFWKKKKKKTNNSFFYFSKRKYKKRKLLKTKHDIFFIGIQLWSSPHNLSYKKHNLLYSLFGDIERLRAEFYIFTFIELFIVVTKKKYYFFLAKIVNSHDSDWLETVLAFEMIELVGWFMYLWFDASLL